MLTNILILVAIIGLAYWYGVQGFFTAFLHLILTIVAIALSLALWEPLVQGLLIERLPWYAWGVGLLGPFVLILIVLRVLMDLLVPGNVNFGALANFVGGCLCGALSAILTTGFAVVGLGFIPISVDLGGYQPLSVAADSTVSGQAGQGLWLPVDRMTVGFFNGLSTGTFSTSTPLADYRPDLARQACLARLRYDANASVSASPSAVQVLSLDLVPRPRRQAGEAQDPPPIRLFVEAQKRINDSDSLALVQTQWKITRGTFDEDSTLRLPPTQVRLLVWSGPPSDPQPSLLAPIAVFNRPPGQNDAQWTPTLLADDRASAYALRDGEQIAFVFPVPRDATPRHLLIRQTRFALPEPARAQTDAALAIIRSVDRPAVALLPDNATNANPDPHTGTIEQGHSGPTQLVGMEIVISQKLPDPISMNMANLITFSNKQILKGEQEVRKPTHWIDRNVFCDSFQVPGHQVMVRLSMGRRQAQTYWGTTLASAAMINGLYLRDSAGNRIPPSGYVWRRPDGSQYIFMDRIAPIDSGKKLPITRLGPDDILYLYFIVPKDTSFTSLDLGSRELQKVELTVPK